MATESFRSMRPATLFLLTALAVTAFAANSLLCRLALRQEQIDAATFVSIRIVTGAGTLWFVGTLRGGVVGGNWISAFALFGYAVAFSFAYLDLPAGTGALLLFVAVQATMITAGIVRGERMHLRQWCGIFIAFAGLVWLLFPGLSAPPIGEAALMLAAGAGWGVYSLCGRTAADPVAATAGNFIRAVPLALLCALAFIPRAHLTPAGAIYAGISGAITSGLGYIVWYRVLPSLSAATAATVQLSAPVITAVGGIFLLSEMLTTRLLFAAIAVLGGIGLVVSRN